MSIGTVLERTSKVDIDEWETIISGYSLRQRKASRSQLNKSPMRSSAIHTITLLFPHYLSYAAGFVKTVRDEDPSSQPTTAPSVTPIGGGATTAAPSRLTKSTQMSTWRHLDVDLKQCGAVNFTTHVITTHATWAQSVVAADLDGDGDFDVLSASAEDDEISWYENLNGTADFSGQPHRKQANGAYSVTAADLDGDSDLDVLSANSYDRKITWYENLDGTGNFSGLQRVITTQVAYATAAAAADLDGDSDLDVLSASWSDNKIAWYENLDGAGNFSGPQRVITTQAKSAPFVVAADLDTDGDLDVLWAARSGDTKMAWHENLDGAGNFTGPPHIITTKLEKPVSFVAADLDSDGDVDILAAFDASTVNSPTIVWYENLDGAGDFSGPQRVITTLVTFPGAVAAADLDGDGDLDVISTSDRSNTVNWYENVDGAGDFSGPLRVITTQIQGGTSLAVADLDRDGDLDVLSASRFDNKIAWYENDCVPMTPQPTPEPTYWGPQVFGMKPQTAGFQRLCVVWCGIFGIISAVVLGYVMHASPVKDKNLARTILTILVSQYDYGSDTLFIGFQNFVTPTLFVAALITYLLPLAIFIVTYRRVIRVHLAHIYTSAKAKTIVGFYSSNEVLNSLAQISLFAIFPFAYAASILVYLILLFVFITFKLMFVSFFAVKFFETGGIDCTQETFEIMFKRSILSELVFESSGELIVILIDTGLRAQQDFRSKTNLSSWAVLSIVGSSLMLAFQVRPYLHHIVWRRLGLDAGIAAVSTKLKFTPDEALAKGLINRLLRFTGLYTPDGHVLNDSDHHHSEVQIHVCNVKIIEMAEGEL